MIAAQSAPLAKAFCKYILWERIYWKYSVNLSRFEHAAHPATNLSISLFFWFSRAHSRLIIQNSQWRTAVFIITIFLPTYCVGDCVRLRLFAHYHYNIIFVFLPNAAVEQTMKREANGDDSNVSFHNSLWRATMSVTAFFFFFFF